MNGITKKLVWLVVITSMGNMTVFPNYAMPDLPVVQTQVASKYAIARVQAHEIERHKQDIAFMFSWRGRASTALNIVAGTYAVYLTYAYVVQPGATKVYSLIFGAPQAPSLDPLTKDLELCQKLQKAVEELNNRMKEVEVHRQEPTVFDKAIPGFFLLNDFFIKPMVFNYMLSKAYPLMNDLTMTSFIKEKTLALPSIKQMVHYAHAFDMHQFAPRYKLELDKKSLVAAANNLVASVEQIAGFMAYLVECEQDQDSASDNKVLMVDCVMHETNEFCEQLETIISGHVFGIESPKIAELTAEYVQRLQMHWEQFN